MGLTLIAGPAHAGKVERLLDRYLAVLDREPVLIVPNRPDVDRRERDLLRRCGVLLAGRVCTFDDVFRDLAERDPATRRTVSNVERTLIVQRAIQGSTLNGLGRSARFSGFADSLLATLAELEAGLLDPADLDGDGELARLYAAYRAELDRLDVWDADLRRRRAVELLGSELDAWHGEPVFAYGFEDLTGAEWALLEALAGRADVEVSLPYEPGRAAFESLSRTQEDLAALAQGRIEELPPRSAEYAPAALAHLERHLFADDPPLGPELEGTIRFFEGAGTRGALELVGEELLDLIRDGTAPEQVALVCPSIERFRAPLETVLGTLGIPYALESGELRLLQTPFGQALHGLLRFAWQGGGRRELFAFLRSPYSGLARTSVDFVEGRLRGRAVSGPERVEEEMTRLREGATIPALDALRAATDPVEAVRGLAASMLRAAYGLEEPPVGESSRLDLRTHEAVAGVLRELESWRSLADALTQDDVVAALERLPVRPGGAGEPGRVAVLDLMRARTRAYEVVFVLGLEEGSLPRRGRVSPFLDDDARRALGQRPRLVRPDPVSRERYLFYTACTRATRRLYLVREAAGDEGGPREPSPFWDEVRGLFEPDDAARWTRRRPLSSLTWQLEAAPSERERLRALAALAAQDEEGADAVAAANGWERRLARARRAFAKPTRLVNPVVLEWLREKTTFNVTELERFADCSSAWLHERVVDPKTIDAEADAMLRGQVAHTALHKFYAGLPKEVGTERVEPERVEEAVGWMRRCLDDALSSGVRLDLTDLQRQELEQSLWRDLEQFVREEARSPLQLVPRRFEVSFGMERSPQELQRGLDLGEGLTLSGKIDRIDLDPFAARGIVQDYKSGKTAHSAQQIEQEQRLQIPLYMLVLRDLVGVEPLGGLYRALAGQRAHRGLLRGDEEGIEGLARNDYVSDEEFWSRVEAARGLAGSLAGRIRSGDIRHDPRGGECPQWCDLWTMCRVKRP
jgi:ATP-dependent helicase/DNAse subunit B